MKRFVVFLVLNYSLLFLSLSASGQPVFLPVGSHGYIASLFERPFSFDTLDADAPVTEVADNPIDVWKQWRTVENYRYGKNRGSLPMIADLQALHPYFRDKVVELLRICASQGITLAIVESYRTPAKQAQYYAMGRKYTSSTGGRSRHQYGLAVDVVPMVDSVAVWNDKGLWRKIGTVGERLGLRWGGRWRVTYDPGHFEWSGGVSRRELQEGLWPQIPRSAAQRYPSIDHDLFLLQKKWQAWAVDQSEMANSRSLSTQDKTIGVEN